MNRPSKQPRHAPSGTSISPAEGNGETFHEAVGAVHLHSTHSDGALPIPEIAPIAGRKGLDFLMFSDHHTLEPKRLGLEGWYERVLVLIGYEINDANDRNHYLAFRLTKEVEEGLKAADYVRRVREMGGFGVIAHPAEKRNFSEAYPPYPWTDWEADSFDGIEIWNQLSEWIEGVTRRNIAWRIVHPLKSIRYPVWETLERWDQLNRRRRVVGLGGIDVHAYRLKIAGIPFTVYPYKVQFRSIRTHLLVRKALYGDSWTLPFQEAEDQIFEALREGRCFVSNHVLGDARGFQFVARCGDGFFQAGSRLSPGTGVLFQVETPQPADIRLLQNGRIIYRVKGFRLSYSARAAGVYRAEVFRKRRGWIYSNPIVIQGE